MIPPSASVSSSTRSLRDPFDAWLKKRLRDCYAPVMEEDLPVDIILALPPATTDR